MRSGKRRFSTAERSVAIVLAIIWIGASMAAIVAGLSRGRWVLVAIGPLGMIFGILWARAAQVGRTLRWNDVIHPKF